MGAERGDAWVGVGGGMTTDMVGTAAALYVRGVPFVAVATTWLGMTDAAIGGKVAVDLPAAKNAAGAFWPPVGHHRRRGHACGRCRAPGGWTAWPSRSRAASSATRSCGRLVETRGTGRAAQR